MKHSARVVLLLAVTFLSGMHGLAGATATVHKWSKILGGTAFETVSSVAYDSSGSVIVIGSTQSESIDLGGGNLIGPNYQYDILLAKYSSHGAHLWSKRIGGPENEAGVASVDSLGNVFVAATTESSTVDLGGGSLPGPESPDYWDPDIVIAKYGTDGGHLWSKRFASVGPDFVSSIAVGSTGTIMLVGSASAHSIDFGGNPLVGDGFGSVGSFLVTFDGAGQHLWSKGFAGNFLSYFSSVATDSLGNLILAGTTTAETVDLGGGPLIGAGDYGGDGPDDYDILLAKYAPAGNHIWSKRFVGVANSAIARGVTTDQSGNIVLAGYSDGHGPLDLGGGPLAAKGGACDMALGKFDPDGSHVWSKRLGGGGCDDPTAVATDASGGIVVAGFTESQTVDFGGGTMSVPRYGDMVLIKYEADGSYSWSRLIGGSYWEMPTSVATNAGTVTVAGYTYSDSVDFGGGRLSTFGSGDLVVAQYEEDGAPPISTLDRIVITNDPLRRGYVTGSSGDNVAGIQSVVVTFTSITSGRITRSMATLTCSNDRLQCSFAAKVPPAVGVYDVNAQATDRVGNEESPGPRTLMVLA
jgi:hypothetical protein